MHKFSAQLLAEWRRLGLPVADAVFVVAISGGADSVALAAALFDLRRLKKLNLRFVCAHFNHNLRGEESDADEHYVRRFAEKSEFELACGKPDEENPFSKVKNNKGNLEQNARFARYNFLLDTAENLRAAGVLTAHTMSDQAETFLLNLIRGSGLQGLGGIKPLRDFSNAEFPGAKNETRDAESEDDSPSVTHESSEAETLNETGNQNRKTREPTALLLARPLLNWATRELTENFCLENKIEFRLDSMNDDLAFRRVRIRKILLPLLADFNPKIVETLAKTAELLRSDFSNLENSAAEKAKNLRLDERENEHILPVKDLKNLFPSMRRQILRDWLKNCRAVNLRRLDSKHIEAIDNLIGSRRSGRKIELPGGETIIKSGGKLLFEKAKVEKSRSDNYNQRLDFEGAPSAIENNE